MLEVNAYQAYAGAKREKHLTPPLKCRQNSTSWIAQLDLDEFMFPRRRASLRDVLQLEPGARG